MDKLLFLILSLISVGSAFGVIFSKHAVSSVLFLVVTFFSIAGHFILLQAQFLAIVNVIVYAGAIMVLFLFVIMLLNLNKETEPARPFLAKLAAAVAGGLLLVALTGVLKGANQLPAQLSPLAAEVGTVQNLGKVLFSDFILPFEISSVLFLSAMIGAVMLGKKDLNKH